MDGRKLMRYALYSVEPAWVRLPAEERSLHKKELVEAFAAPGGPERHSYSTVGLRADTDLCLWLVADEPEELQSFQARLNATALGRHLRPVVSYLAMTRKSQYLKGHTHAGQEQPAAPVPAGGRYLFVYPMDKQRPWYRLPFDERRRIMGEHLRIGHRYPGVTIHTGYSFGIDDQEFVVAFEADAVSEFLDLVEELRGSESSAYTARDVPIYTCVRMPLTAILDQLDGRGVWGAERAPASQPPISNKPV